VDGPEDNRDIARAREVWESDVLKPHLERRPESDHPREASPGIPLDTLFTPADIARLDYLEDLGFPGCPPFTRGVYPNMYRGRLWTFRQYAGFGTCEETNRRFRYLLERGQTGLSVAFDLPTQMGYDSDHPMSLGEVGRSGVAIDSLEDMERLFAGIPLDRVSTSMTINSTAPVLLAMLVVVAEDRGIKRQDLAGTVQNDVLKEYIARGTYVFPPAPSLKLTTDIFAFCSREMPRWNTISVSGYHIREAGATAVQEVAFTLADGVTYIDHAIRAGLEVDDFAPRISFFFGAHNNLLEEIAKFRAARRLWARIVKERFGARDPRSLMLRFHTQTCGSTLTAQQPLNNIVRVTMQALAAVLGGTQSLHTNSYDEALSLPTERAVQVALRTQQIIAHESGSVDTVDPLGGSYALEHLTGQIERGAEDYIRRVEDMGGVIAAIESGFLKGEIEASAYKAQKAVERGEQVVVGVNRFTGETEPPAPFEIDAAIEREQLERLARLKQTRDRKAVSAAIEAVGASARAEENMMEPVIQAVRAKVTLGEICDALRAVYGTFEEVEPG
jgi:methylmalonyl-CoA mutase N-terminal domain/subunit